jgi:hypothetical protein
LLKWYSICLTVGLELAPIKLKEIGTVTYLPVPSLSLLCVFLAAKIIFRLGNEWY